MNELAKGKREIWENYFFSSNVSNAVFQHLVFRRVGGKEKTISDVNFSFMIFEDGYFRKCIFKNCNFTGTVFRNSNFDASIFEDCNFSYAEFFGSRFDENILECKPQYTNLQREFARRLRNNFKNIGEIELENRATKLEIEATSIFLFDAWYDGNPEGYYRKKYKGRARAWKFFEWCWHKFLFVIWGNGESFSKLFSTILFGILAAGILSTLAKENVDTSTWMILYKSPFIFFGAYEDLIKGWAEAVILFLRLTLFGLLLSMLIKKWALR